MKVSIVAQELEQSRKEYWSFLSVFNIHAIPLVVTSLVLMSPVLLVYHLVRLCKRKLNLYD